MLMAKLKRSGAKQPEQSGDDALAALGGPTKTGWSFYGSALDCWRMWYLRYVEGVRLKTSPEFFRVGIAYHALREGRVSVDKLARAVGPEIMGEATRLAEARATDVPIGIIEQKEVTCGITKGPLAGLFTSKPDVIERDPDSGKRVGRDYKTTSHHRETDDAHWNAAGSVIGEMITAGIDKVIVDVISKGKKAPPRVCQYAVRLTEAKRLAFEGVILDLVEQIRARMARWAAAKSGPLLDRDATLARLFPCNLNHCAMPRTCDYYDWCWGGGAGAKANYVIRKPADWQSSLLRCKP